jgi:NitT/TauT family transport system substrate-binding protein
VKARLSAVTMVALLLLPVFCRAADEMASLAADAELVEARTSVPKLKAAAPYEPKDGVIEIELSEYAGYAGLIVANGGLEPNDDSYFARKHGFKVRITISEEDSWSALNSGRLAGSATTADVLPLYGSQLQVVVPALISFSRGADAIVVRSPIRQINDLKGKTLAVCQFNESDFFLRYLAQQAGLDVHVRPDFTSAPDREKINIVAAADSFGAGDLFLRDMNAGRNRIDGCVTWEPKTSEVIEGSGGKAKLLVSNKNLLIVADIFILNKGFAEAHPETVRGLVEGLLEGNRMLRTDPSAHVKTVAKAFAWSESDAKDELGKVHLANLPENLAFFSGAIDSAGSFGYIYESSGLAYGSQYIPSSFNGEKFLRLGALEAVEKEGLFSGQRADIQPIRSGGSTPVEQPLLARDIRFLFQPNSSKLDLANQQNHEDLQFIAKMLQVSPGSTVLLRGHVDDSMVPTFQKQGGPEFVQKMSLRAVQLSKERCADVRKALIDLHKVDAQRIDMIGLGWKEPLGRDMEQNRRVEVQWFTVE